MKLALDNPGDQVILGALRVGDDRRAASLLVETLAPRAYQLCRLASHDAATADDLTVRGFTRALGRLAELRGEKTPAPWLLGHVWQTCAEGLLPPLRDACSDVGWGSSEGRDPELEPVRRALVALDPLARAALALTCSAIFPGCAVDEAIAQQARDIVEGMRLQLAKDGQPASTQAICQRLVELRWPLSAELERRLAVLCAAL